MANRLLWQLSVPASSTLLMCLSTQCAFCFFLVADKSCIEFSPVVAYGLKKVQNKFYWTRIEFFALDTHRILSHRFLRTKKKYRTSSIDTLRILSRSFYGLKKQNDKGIEHILSVSVREKRRFGNYHEVLLYFLLFVVKNKKNLFFCFDRQKTVFTTPLTRNTLSTNISTNIANVVLPLAVLVRSSMIFSSEKNVRFRRSISIPCPYLN